MRRIRHSLLLAALVGGFLFCSVVTREAAAQEGCKNYLGRAREKMCETQAGYDACLDLVKRGAMDACVIGGKVDSWVRRPPNFDPEGDLIKRGCKKLNGNRYQCEEKVFAWCRSYENYYKVNPMVFPVGAPNIQPVAGCQLAPVDIFIPSGLEGGNLYVYVAGFDGALWTIKKNFGTWGNGKSLGGRGIIGLDACSPNPGKTVVMLRGTGNVLGSAIFDNSTGKSGWVNYSSLIGSDPGTACQPGDKVNLFVRGHNNNELYAAYAENGVWAQMYQLDGGHPAIEDVAGKAAALKKKDESFWNFGGAAFTSGMLGASGLGGGMKGSPDGVSFGGNNRAVFVRGNDDYIWWRVTFDGKPWEQFESLGGLKMTSDPTAVSRKPGEILVFARGEDNKLWVKQYLNGTWRAWLPWGGTVAGNPDATSWGGNRVDVVYRGTNGEVYHAWLDDALYGKEPKIEKIPGVITNADPTIVAATW